MKTAFAILVCCLVALLPESRTDTQTEAPYDDAQICRKERKVNDPTIIEHLTPEEKEKLRCSFATCILKRTGELGADDDVFSEELFLEFVPEFVKEGAPTLINDCKVKASGNSCKFANCVIEIQIQMQNRISQNITEHERNLH